MFRSASGCYVTRDNFFTGAGAKAAARGWDSADIFATVYTSMTPETATLEALAHFRHHGLPVESALPQV